MPRCESRRIAGVRRVGKHIVFDLEPAAGVGRAPSPAKGRNRGRGSSSRKKRADEGARPTPQSSAQWIIHLGMTGRMVVGPPESEMAKHTHLVAKLASGQGTAFCRSAAFWAFECGARLRSLGFRAARGPERPFCQPLPWTKNSHQKCSTEPETFARRGQHLRRRVVVPRRSSPAAARFVAYPGRPPSAYPAVQEVLREAIALGGSSVSDYVDADGEEGFFQLRHRVYGREGEPCLVCKTTIKRVVIAGRSSHYCPECQQ